MDSPDIKDLDERRSAGELMKPYYEHAGITIYHGDCREIINDLPSEGIVVSDPPYGINHPTNYASRGRSRLATCKDYPPVFDDDRPFDPAPWITRWPSLLFGAIYFSDKLPPSSGWVVWDKERPEDLDQATCELAWSNFIKGARLYRFLWHGMLRASNEALSHPTQKPVSLMRWILKWVPGDHIILDPFMGSGSTLVASKDLHRSAIGIEIEERYCDIAARRLSQEVFDFGGGENQEIQRTPVQMEIKDLWDLAS